MTPEAVRWILTQSLPKPVIYGLGGADEIAEILAPLGEEAVHAIVAEIPAAWPVSQILTLDILERFPDALPLVETNRVHEWVAGALSRYEAAGLSGARRYLDASLQRYQEGAAPGPGFGDLRRRLVLYVGGLAERRIAVEEGETAFTDGAAIFLPESLPVAAPPQEQTLIYKYAATLQWAALRFGTFLLPGPKRFFAGFPDPPLALYLWNLLETHRLEGKIGRRLPGLARDVDLARKETRGGTSAALKAAGACVEELAVCWDLEGIPGDGNLPGEVHKCLEVLSGPSSSLDDTCAETRRLVAAFSGLQLPPADFPKRPVHALTIMPEDFETVRFELRRVLREEFVRNLAQLLLVSREGRESGNDTDTDAGTMMAGPVPSTSEPLEETVALFVEPGRARKPEPGVPSQGRMLTLPDKTNGELADRLRELEEQIAEDRGGVPREYVSAAQGMAGRAALVSGMPGKFDDAERDLPSGTVSAVYDEWDVRRLGYRKDWCHVVELEPAPARGNFVENTVRTHYGTVQSLKRQFEMLRREQRFLRGQRDGDDIDLDASIEALADMKAGLSPSERLFVRLDRSERDIVTLFLVDMSASTEGWVSTTIKESLVLLCEALERLGDRYGIAGFSGMRRTRSEWYPIKRFDEPYDETVKSRITGIVPRDYTRMGPAIRHGTRLLAGQDHRTRILLTLSDGKPEDYDDYKGDYAIEDTRRALIEARAVGVHPFCITVDREARDYLPHMFGERDYVLVHDVRLLPARLPEIYRTITT